MSQSHFAPAYMGKTGQSQIFFKITKLNYQQRDIFLHSNPPKYMNEYVKIITLDK